MERIEQTRNLAEIYKWLKSRSKPPIVQIEGWQSTWLIKLPRQYCRAKAKKCKNPLASQKSRRLRLTAGRFSSWIFKMSTQIYINLAVKDLPAARAFYAALGFGNNPMFTNEHAACVVVSERIYVMLLTEANFLTFAPGAICDTKTANETLLCLSQDSRESVDAMVARAVAAGGTTHKDPIDRGFLYGHGFQDLDGHAWELLYMDLGALPRV